MRKELSMKQHIKASVGTRKFLSEFCLEVLSIEYNINLLSFVSFKRFSSVKIYKIWCFTSFDTKPATKPSFLLYSSFSVSYISSSYS